MRKIFISIIALLSLAAGANAQERIKRFENIFQIGGGLFMESGTFNSGNNPGLALRLSYGLDVKVDENWSIMPGIGATGMIGVGSVVTSMIIPAWMLSATSVSTLGQKAAE